MVSRSASFAKRRNNFNGRSKNDDLKQNNYISSRIKQQMQSSSSCKFPLSTPVMIDLKIQTKLIQSLSASEEQRTRQLFSEECLRDRRPPQLLRHLRSLAGAIVVQDNVLSSELVDKILEVAPRTPSISGCMALKVTLEVLILVALEVAAVRKHRELSA
ncbi:hypothetical protein J6590_085907 [Homalodisca vitripennis]|nr:hypothetical protein J6590_085907 [Homalodisca vitripennis]